MSLIPAFQIGVWNAWIFMIWLLIPIFLEPLNIIPKGREEGSDFTTEFNKMQKIALLSLHIIYLLSVIYSIFIPLKLGTVWFYAGLPIYILGLIPYAMVLMALPLHHLTSLLPREYIVIQDIQCTSLYFQYS